MSADPRKRQKKLERRSAKRKTKHHEIAREKSAGLPERLAAAASFPIVDSFVTMDLWDRGMGYIVLSRALPNGSVAVAGFLVDRYCLGVKDAFARITSRYDYDNETIAKIRSQSRCQDVSPATARRFVESAVEYARGLGFAPHPDYQRAKLIFGDIDPAAGTESLEFGKDGKPLYIAGPFDDQNRQQQILTTLERTQGPGGYDVVLALRGARGFSPAQGMLTDEVWIEDECDD